MERICVINIMVNEIRYNDDSYLDLVIGNACKICLAKLEARNRT